MLHLLLTIALLSPANAQDSPGLFRDLSLDEAKRTLASLTSPQQARLKESDASTPPGTDRPSATLSAPSRAGLQGRDREATKIAQTLLSHLDDDLSRIALVKGALTAGEGQEHAERHKAWLEDSLR